MAGEALAKFRRRVKAIERETGKTYVQARKQASAESKSGKKLSGTKKKAGKKKTTSKGRKVGSVSGTGSSLGTVVTAAKHAIKEKLGWALATQATAKTKKEKRGLAPMIADYKKKLKALS